MKIIITESQYKMLLESNTESIQNLIDMAFQALKDDIGNYFFNVEHIEDAVDATEKIEVVDVQKVTSKNYFENKENSIYFRAAGNEPFWSLKMSESNFEFSYFSLYFLARL